MRALKLFGRTITSIYLLMIVVTAVLSVCVWIFSPFIGTDAFRPFDEPFGRIIFISILWLICLIILISVFFVRRQNAKQLEEDIVKGPKEESADAEDEVVSAELSELRELRPGRQDLVLAYHLHFTTPLACLILVLLTLTLAVQFERGSRIGRVIIAFFVCVAYLVVDLTCRSLGLQQFINPVVAESQ